ncbi:hypothetical protein SUDANB1_07568 [Streptomyces sp. enrichment culture]|uniref:hypothetical protein n=1 Tax=Streptomyces sp. enrichment culture TaxID=1795815 RepID=UPI003F55050D
MSLAMHAVALYPRVTAKPGSSTAERAPDRMRDRATAGGTALDVTVCEGAVYVYPLTPVPEGRAAAIRIVEALSDRRCSLLRTSEARTTTGGQRCLHE